MGLMSSGSLALYIQFYHYSFSAWQPPGITDSNYYSLSRIHVEQSLHLEKLVGNSLVRRGKIHRLYFGGPLKMMRREKLAQQHRPGISKMNLIAQN